MSLNYRRYPYLIDPWDYASLVLGFERAFERIAEDDSLLALALSRIKACIEGELGEISRSTEEEVFSFWLSLLALKASNSVYLLGRVIDVEVDRISKILEREPVETLKSIARALGVRVEDRTLKFPWLMVEGKVIYRTLDLAIPVADFLRYASSSKLEELRLVNNFVRDGYVYVDRPRLVKLLIEASRRFIVEKLKTMEIPESKAFEKLVEEVKRLEHRETLGFKEELLPDCIKQLTTIARTRRLSDEEVYVILSFLSAIGAPQDYVENLLAELGLAERSIAEVIAESLQRLRGYTPFKCEELKRRGICECDEDLVKSYMARARKHQHPRRS